MTFRIHHVRSSCRLERKLRHVKLPALCCITSRPVCTYNAITSVWTSERDAFKYFRVLRNERAAWEEEKEVADANCENIPRRFVRDFFLSLRDLTRVSVYVYIYMYSIKTLQIKDKYKARIWLVRERRATLGRFFSRRIFSVEMMYKNASRHCYRFSRRHRRLVAVAPCRELNV